MLNINRFIKSFKNILICIVTLYFVYNVNYKINPLGIPTSYLTLVYFSFIGWLCIVMKRHLMKIQLVPLILAILFIMCSMFSFILSSKQPDFYMLKISILYFFIILFLPIFLNYYFHNTQSKVLLALGYAGTINGIIIIAMLLYPDFRLAYIDLISEVQFVLVGENAAESLMSLRMVGVTGLSVYSAGFVQTTLAMVYLLYLKLNYQKPTAINIACIITMLTSAFFVARSSLVGIVLFVISYKYFFDYRSMFKLLFAFFISGTCVIFAVYIFLPSFYEFFFNWAFEIFLKGSQAGSLETNIAMYRYGLNDFSLFGDSKWFSGNGGYYMRTDVGWHRLLFCVGYLGAFTWLLLLLSVIGIRNIKRMFKNNISFIIVMLSIYVIIIMCKGAIMFDAFQIMAVFVVLLWLSDQDHQFETQRGNV